MHPRFIPGVDEAPFVEMVFWVETRLFLPYWIVLSAPPESRNAGRPFLGDAPPPRLRG